MGKEKVRMIVNDLKQRIVDTSFGFMTLCCYLTTLLLTSCYNKEAECAINNDESVCVNFMGYSIKDSIGHSPMTELITITDSVGNLFAEAGRASEGSDFDFVKFIRDNAGEVVGLESFIVSYDDMVTIDSLSDHAKSLIFGYGQDKDYIHRYRFDRNSQGLIKQVRDILHGVVMKAPDGFTITYAVEEDSLFWTSCLNGGQFNITFKLIPIKFG